MDDKKALIAAVGEAAAAPPGEGEEGSATKYESLLAYVKRHSAR